MMKIGKNSFLYVFLIVSIRVSAGSWTDLNTGINDKLNDVWFSSNYGLLAGNHGIYYTSTGGSGSGSWTRLVLSNNIADSILYERTQFLKIANKGSGVYYFMGNDTVGNRGVVFAVNYSTHATTVYFKDSNTSYFNNIEVNKNNSSTIYIVGNGGLFISIRSSSFSLRQQTNTTKDLYSVNYPSGNSTYLDAGGDDIFMRGFFGNNDSINFANYNQPGTKIRSVLTSTNVYCAGNSFYKVVLGNIGLQEVPYYKHGFLNASCGKLYNSILYYITDHGLYRSGANDFRFLEYSAELTDNDLHGIYFDNGATYGCGDSGKLLKATNVAGKFYPVAFPLTTGKCRGDSLHFYGITNIQNSCKWFVDTVQQTTSCDDMGAPFDSPGSHSIKWVVTNSWSLTDTGKVTIQIVDTPAINMPATYSDTLFCKQGLAQITLSTSQVNVNYGLYSKNDTLLHGLVAGSGAQVMFYSDTLILSGWYYIRSESASASCNSNFSDSTRINVEHTKAIVHSSRINATPSESVNFFSLSTDASHFNWTFTDGAHVDSSFVINPTAIYFPIIGNTVIKLVCSSTYGCMDSIDVNGPYIYNEPLTDDSCWAMEIKGDATLSSGNLSHLTVSDSGFLVCGAALVDTLPSSKGEALISKSMRGVYMAKYSTHGILKWKAGSVDTSGFATPVATYISTDRDNNILLCGTGNGTGVFYDNTGIGFIPGHKAITTSFPYMQAFLIKFTPEGSLMWSAAFNQPTARIIKSDQDGNIYMLGSMDYNGGIITCLHADTLDTLINVIIPYNSEYMFKFSPSGKLIWKMYFSITNTNQAESCDFSFDDSNNIYLAGSYETKTVFYDASGVAVDSLTNKNRSTYGKKGFLVKFNSDGLYKWKVDMYYPVVSSIDATRPLSIATDATGNSYVTGGDIGTGSKIGFVVKNTDGSVDTNKVGSYFLNKIDSTGNQLWCVGSDSGYFSPGYSVCRNDSEVTVLGYLANGGNQVWDGIMYSTDGNNRSFTEGWGDFFITVYDTSGKIKYLTKTGDNANSLQMGGSPWITRDALGNHYISYCGRLYLNDTSHMVFNTVITPHYYNGIIGKTMSIPCEACAYFSVQAQPSNQQVDAGDTASFIIVSSSSNTNYQWQTKAGNTWQNLFNGIYYSGVNNDTLNVLITTTANNNQQFRCKLSSVSCSAISDSAVLKVITIGINEVNSLNQIYLYPNPVSNEITIKITKPIHEMATVIIVNTMGQIVYQESMNLAVQAILNVKDLPGGVYFLRLKTTSILGQKKFVKE